MKEVKAFKCDYCGKLYRNKLVLKHEAGCKQNPNNKHDCFEFCKYLVVGRESVDEESYRRTFFCSKYNKYMYSYIAERRGYGIIKNLERMPIKCGGFEINGIDDF